MEGNAGGASLFRCRFLHTSSALLSGFWTAIFRLSFTFARVSPLRFVSSHRHRAKQHCVARYDLAVSCFLLTVLRHKIRCSGCCYWYCFTFPCVFRARSLSPLTTSNSRLAHVHTLAAACASAPRIWGCIYRSHSTSVVDHSLYFRGELFNILPDWDVSTGGFRMIVFTFTSCTHSTQSWFFPVSRFQFEGVISQSSTGARLSLLFVILCHCFARTPLDHW